MATRIKRLLRRLQLPCMILLLCGAAAPGPARATAPYHRAPMALSTPWSSEVSSTTPLPDYPRPELERSQWLNLNGRWEYEAGRSGEPPPFGRRLAQTILVPFPVASPLSGIARGDRFGWYRRSFRVPAGWRGQRVRLNFGAVSWLAQVYVNGHLATSHLGDYGSFSTDVTRWLHGGQANELVVGFVDPVGAAGEPVGKQVPGPPSGYYHTAANGIWQTVWLEPVSPTHVSTLNLTADPRRARLAVQATVSGPVPRRGVRLLVQAYAGSRAVATGGATLSSGMARLELRIPRPHLWSPSDPYLYGLEAQLTLNGRVIDAARSYFAMRSITVGRVGGVTRLLLNGRSLFQAGVLDQGYWPDGVYTAPTDAALRSDIEAARGLGFDMIRKHAKVEPDRWYYWADRLGMLVWQDMPSMPPRGGAVASPAARREFLRELTEVVRQLAAHPSIVMWVPFNEGWAAFGSSEVDRLIRRLDPTRLVDIDSGSASCCGVEEPADADVRDVHLYFGPFTVPPDRRASVIGEFGGVLPVPPAAHRWPGTATSIGSPVMAWPLPDISALIQAQYANLEEEERAGGLSASVFTELTATEQELGILTYDRRFYTLAPSLFRRLNESVIDLSLRSGDLRPQRAQIASGSTDWWRFDEGAGGAAADARGSQASASSGSSALTLQGGAGWTRGVRGAALSITGPGQDAVSSGPRVDTSRSFTVSGWLSTRRAGQSGSAVSEAGPNGSLFSLGIASLSAADQPPRSVWAFAAPSRSGCAISQCGVAASMHYSDGRFTPRLGAWSYVTGVFDTRAHTIAVFVNGLLQDIEHITYAAAPTGPLTVGSGAGVYATADTFIGAVDELRIYPRPLRPAEVWQLYRASRGGTSGNGAAR